MPKFDVTDSVRQIINDFAWDTTRYGRAEPTVHDVRRLEKTLGRELTHDEMKLLQFKWLEALQP
jgi:hypothetical protein